jgi:hypothetical protein
MKKNVGLADSVIRIVIAVTVVVLFFANIITGTLAMVLLAVSAVLGVTGILGICPLYMVAGLNSVKRKV